MRQHHPAAGPELPAEERSYRAARASVDDARGRLSAVLTDRHSSAAVRAAASDLAVALSAAVAVVRSRLQCAQACPARQGHRRGHPREVQPRVSAWSGELVRLSEIAVWLRLVTIDEPGVRAPSVVRIGSRAALAPHVAGLVFEPDDLVGSTLHQPRIGVDLEAVIDGGTDQMITLTRDSRTAATLAA
ncbi:MAG: hypothetical protein ACYCO3_05580 [Mycobacteriales bacterium]